MVSGQPPTTIRSVPRGTFPTPAWPNKVPRRRGPGTRARAWSEVGRHTPASLVCLIRTGHPARAACLASAISPTTGRRAAPPRPPGRRLASSDTCPSSPRAAFLHLERPAAAPFVGLCPARPTFQAAFAHRRPGPPYHRLGPGLRPNQVQDRCLQRPPASLLPAPIPRSDGPPGATGGATQGRCDRTCPHPHRSLTDCLVAGIILRCVKTRMSADPHGSLRPESMGHATRSGPGDAVGALQRQAPFQCFGSWVTPPSRDTGASQRACPGRQRRPGMRGRHAKWGRGQERVGRRRRSTVVSSKVPTPRLRLMFHVERFAVSACGAICAPDRAHQHEDARPAPGVLRRTDRSIPDTAVRM